MALSSHESPVANTTSWLTPPWIVKSLGKFDLDPCGCEGSPFVNAETVYYKDGLEREWFGRVFLNPPYGREIGDWMKRMSEHRNGTALIFARTDTKFWHDYIWPYAHAILFLKGRLHFHYPNGERAKANAGAPSVLISYSLQDTIRLHTCNIEGKLVEL